MNRNAIAVNKDPSESAVGRLLTDGSQPLRRTWAGYRLAVTPAACYFVFFLSGIAALIYEISWARQIGILLGHTVHAAAIVLASYFSGLAIGYLLGGRLASRVSPLVAYAIAEIAVATWACLTPFLLSLVESTDAIKLLSNDAWGVQISARAIFCFALLLPATIALGATLPFMAELFSRTSKPTAGRVARAYALNTAGAVVGVISATFYLLVVLGVRSSSYFAAGLSVACALVALSLAWLRPRTSTAVNVSVVSRSDSEPERENSTWWMLLAGLSGFGTLALEVLYLRLFSLVFHNSTRPQSMGLQSSDGGDLRRATLPMPVRKGTTPRQHQTCTAWLAAIGIVLSVFLFVWVTNLEYFAFGETFADYLLGGSVLAALVVLPPVTLLGMILPTMWKASPSSAGSGRVVGRLSAANTLAAAAGAASASFLFLPTFGLWLSFGFVAVMFLTIAACGFVRCRQTRWALFCGAAFLFFLAPFVTQSCRWTQSDKYAGERIVRRWEGAYGWIDVVESNNDGSRMIRQNLHYRFGATGKDATRESRQAHLPLLLHDNPTDVLFLGLGTGLTAAAAISHDPVERIAVIELIPEVVEAARLLSPDNNGVVDHSKVNVRVDDARHYLMATDQQFDVIIADLFVPWESETGYLYTTEHYQMARHHLKADGLFCQWLPLYQVGTREFEMIADSFASVFPNTTIWWGHLDAHQPIIALVGSEQPLELDFNNLEPRFPVIWPSADSVDETLRTPSRLLDLYLGDWPLRTDRPLNTDEHPRVEFLTPISHRNRELIKGPILLEYFDEVLIALPSAGVRVRSSKEQPVSSTEQRRAAQRLILFGSMRVHVIESTQTPQLVANSRFDLTRR